VRSTIPVTWPWLSRLVLESVANERFRVDETELEGVEWLGTGCAGRGADPSAIQPNFQARFSTWKNRTEFRSAEAQGELHIPREWHTRTIGVVVTSPRPGPGSACQSADLGRLSTRELTTFAAA
jgi:hypothetical protein